MKTEEFTGILSDEIARDIWVRLHDKSINAATFSPEGPLTVDEQQLYDILTKRFVHQSTIVGFEVKQTT